MFETEIDDVFSFLAFFAQQLGIFFVFVFWGGLGAGWIGPLPLFRGGGFFTAAINIGWGLIPAFFLGRWTRSSSPGRARSGGYIWLLPSGLMAWALVSGAVHSTLAKDLRDLFCPPQENRLDGLVVGLFTVPMLGCIGYSVGIWFQGKYGNQRIATSAATSTSFQ